ncbi:MAG: hypothetical protein ABJI60_00885 [Kangiellaceae bacterium]|jgi:hypothetical protein
MSRDNYIYLTEEEFPCDVLEMIVSDFEGKLEGTNSWIIESDDGPVRISSNQLKGSELGSDYNWCIGIHFQAPYGPKKLWLAYIIPYQCLLLLKKLKFHSGQCEFKTSSADEFEEFANSDILKYTSVQKLHKKGLLTGNERLKTNM